jgi:hypothetical protein
MRTSNLRSNCVGIYLELEKHFERRGCEYNGLGPVKE